MGLGWAALEEHHTCASEIFLPIATMVRGPGREHHTRAADDDSRRRRGAEILPI